MTITMTWFSKVRTPSFRELAKETAKAGKPIYWNFGLHGLNYNPLFYKCRWRVFWLGSPTDGNAFHRQEKYQMCTAEAMTLRADLEARGESYWLYDGDKNPRLDPRSPFDMNHPRWKNAKWQSSYEQDNDPEWLSPWGVTYK